MGADSTSNLVHSKSQPILEGLWSLSF